ncbi:MAG: hypothetical protein K2K72_00055 [Duncaniella sp.]|nr:hypothetical protein [Duncaniella sp.]
MKEIILFCYGDSRDASTWSNVPYLMALSFERRGVKVNRVDISPDERVSHVISRLMRLMKMGRGNCYTRSTLFRILTERRIKKAVRKYADADFCVFLNFDFYNRYSQVPSLVFSDWTFKILSERGGFKQMGYEKKFLKWQGGVLNNATLVLPLFSDSVAKMRVDYPHANIVGIDRNVINCLDSETLDENTVITKKLSSNYVLFIGREAYKEGLKILIEAIGRLDRPIELHVIGMSGREIAKAPDFVKFHGFLRKDNPSECRLYYDLLRNARLLVNPTPEWAGYSQLTLPAHSRV